MERACRLTEHSIDRKRSERSKKIEDDVRNSTDDDYKHKHRNTFPYSKNLSSIENNQPNALNRIFLFIPYNGYYMFRQLYAIIREHLITF
jgi:hypothetical protein